MGRVPVTIVLPVRNEVVNLARCLAAVAWADEVFVVDSGSVDASRAIAEAHGAKVVQFVQWHLAEGEELGFGRPAVQA